MNNFLNDFNNEFNNLMGLLELREFLLENETTYEIDLIDYNNFFINFKYGDIKIEGYYYTNYKNENFYEFTLIGTDEEIIISLKEIEKLHELVEENRWFSSFFMSSDW